MPLEIITDASYIPPEWADNATGLVYRDMKSFPVGAFAPPAQIPLVPRNDWQDLCRQMEADKRRLSDIRAIGNNGRRMPAKDQNDPQLPRHWGYCWFYATTGGLELVRATMHQPYVPLSAFSGAYAIKQGKNEGGWGAQSLDWLNKRGVPSESTWPNFKRQFKDESSPEWTEALKYRFTDAWVELGDPVYDRDLTFDQTMSCLFNNIPVVVDLMWWGHCVVAIDPVYVNGQFGYRILNSWADSWGENGEGLVLGQRAIPDNAVAPWNAVAA